MRTPQLATARLMLVLLFSSMQSTGQSQKVNVTTWHNDNWRTGQNNSEATLTPSNVSNNFGLVCSFPTQGQVYTQPLVVAHANDSGMEVYVADMNDYAYDFTIPGGWDGKTCSAITTASVNLLASDSGEYPADCCWIGSGNCGTVAPTVGVLGTPVADTNTSTLYLVAESQVGSTGTPGECKTPPPQGWVHRVHALDISSPTNFKSGNEKWGGPVPVKSETRGQATFASENLIQRPGLLLDYQGTTYPTLYMAFSMMDTNMARPSGWVYAYDAWSLGSTSFPLFYATAPDKPDTKNPGSGVWQGGAGLASGTDENGGNYLYLSTANGDYDLAGPPPQNDVGDTFVKLSTNLTPAGQFTPSDEYWRECHNHDMDFGSGGTLLLPDTLFSANEYAVKADKENYLWVIDRTSPGGFTGAGCSGNNICDLTCQPGCGPCMAANNLPELPVAIGTQHGTSPPFSRAAPAFWNGSVNGDAGELYYAIPAGQLQRYPVVTGSCSSPDTGYPPVCNAEATGNDSIISDHTGYSATPSVSSLYTQGSYTNGIAWLIRSEGSASGCTNYAILEAYSAGNANSLDEIYNSYNTNGRDYGICVGCGTKFSVPTIADGYVFVGTQSALNIFGLNPNQPQQSCTK